MGTDPQIAAVQLRVGIGYIPSHAACFFYNHTHELLTFNHSITEEFLITLQASSKQTGPLIQYDSCHQPQQKQ